MTIRVLELFAGTRSIGRAFEKKGHKVFSVEWNKDFDNINLYDDVNNLTAERIVNLMGGGPDVVWASPDCATYSVAAISHHRMQDVSGNLIPKTDYARFCDRTNKHVVDLIAQLKPKYWFIENPVGGLRKMDFMQGLPRYTVTYCQYGDIRQKPTDIWTNHPDPRFRPACKRGAPCHMSAPRGSKRGTQALHGSVDRARIPDALCDHIVNISEE